MLDEVGAGAVFCLVSSGEGMDGNVLWSWWRSHGMDCQGHVWVEFAAVLTGSVDLEIKVGYSRELSLQCVTIIFSSYNNIKALLLN